MERPTLRCPQRGNSNGARLSTAYAPLSESVARDRGQQLPSPQPLQPALCRAGARSCSRPRLPCPPPCRRRRTPCARAGSRSATARCPPQLAAAPSHDAVRRRALGGSPSTGSAAGWSCARRDSTLRTARCWRSFAHHARRCRAAAPRPSLSQLKQSRWPRSCGPTARTRALSAASRPCLTPARARSALTGTSTCVAAAADGAVATALVPGRRAPAEPLPAISTLR